MISDFRRSTWKLRGNHSNGAAETSQLMFENANFYVLIYFYKYFIKFDMVFYHFVKVLNRTDFKIIA